MNRYRDRVLETVVIIGIIFIISLIASCTARADYVYDLQAKLINENIVVIEGANHHYDLYTIYTEDTALLTFDNYNADLISYTQNYESDDPYLYLYTVQANQFNGLESFNKVYELYLEDDDGNYNLDDGLYFYLADVAITNEIVAMITSYDPNVLGTVDFSIYSDNPLTIIPEPMALSFVVMGGVILMITKRKTKWLN